MGQSFVLHPAVTGGALSRVDISATETGHFRVHSPVAYRHVFDDARPGVAVLGGEDSTRGQGPNSNLAATIPGA